MAAGTTVVGVEGCIQADTIAIRRPIWTRADSIGAETALAVAAEEAGPAVRAGGARTAAAVHIGLSAVLDAVIACGVLTNATATDAARTIAPSPTVITDRTLRADGAAAVHIGLSAVLHTIEADGRLTVSVAAHPAQTTRSAGAGILAGAALARLPGPARLTAYSAVACIEIETDTDTVAVCLPARTDRCTDAVRADRMRPTRYPARTAVVRVCAHLPADSIAQHLPRRASRRARAIDADLPRPARGSARAAMGPISRQINTDTVAVRPAPTTAHDTRPV